MSSILAKLANSSLTSRSALLISRRCLQSTCGRQQNEQIAQQQQQQQQQQQEDDNQLSSMSTSNRLQVLEPNEVVQVPAYRILEPDGSLSGELDADLTPEKIIRLYKEMLQLNTMDKILFDSQRQGRISFYMTNYGEEAAQVGSAAALEAQDWIFAQYREAGVLIHRQMPLKLMLAQCYGNKEDLGKGRQMPIHYGSRKLNFVTISSTLTTQLPQAAGVAYALKRQQQQQQVNNNQLVACYFGEGAASEGDAHAAMNFASALEAPVLFFCRNNGYAISTPAREQFRSDGVIHRGLGYGMAAMRVDGNDLFAVYGATKLARRLSLSESRPILIEAMTYRVGHHSTSDDSSAYRSLEEVGRWQMRASPMARLRAYLERANLWSEAQEEVEQRSTREQVIEALNWAERVKKLPVASMFEDVYDRVPLHIARQRRHLETHLDKYGQHYAGLYDQYDQTSEHQ